MPVSVTSVESENQGTIFCAKEKTKCALKASNAHTMHSTTLSPHPSIRLRTSSPRMLRTVLQSYLSSYASRFSDLQISFLDNNPKSDLPRRYTPSSCLSTVPCSKEHAFARTTLHMDPFTSQACCSTSNDIISSTQKLASWSHPNTFLVVQQSCTDITDQNEWH